jgi:hypothetical protein
LAGLVFIPLLFWGNARTSREYLGKYSVAPGPGSDKVVFVQVGYHRYSNVNPLAPETIHAVTKMITDCLYSGPRVFNAGIKAIQKAGRIRRLDVEGCAAVLTALLNAGGKVPFNQFVEGTPDFHPVKVFPQLRDIGGVIFLEADPSGLTLASELRKTLSDLCSHSNK